MKRLSKGVFSPLSVSALTSPKESLLSPAARSRYFYGAPPLFNTAQRLNYLDAITSPPRSLAYYRKPKPTGALNQSISITRLNVVAHRGSFPEQLQHKQSLPLESAACSPMNSKPGSQVKLAPHQQQRRNVEEEHLLQPSDSARQKKEKRGALARIRSTFHKKKKESNASPATHKTPQQQQPIVIPKASTPTKDHELLRKNNTHIQSVEGGCATHEGSVIEPEPFAAAGDNAEEPNPLHLLDSTEFVPGSMNFGAGQQSIYTTTSVVSASGQQKGIKSTPSRNVTPSSKIPHLVFDQQTDPATPAR